MDTTAPVRSGEPIPTTALVLGLGGLIPFVGSALIALAGPIWLSNTAVFALAVYGAVILSFLGGVRWGCRVNDLHAVSDWGPMIWSVIPSLIAWSAILVGGHIMLLLLIGGFGLQYWRDRLGAAGGELPEWFLRLRLMLTTGAVLSLALGLLSV